VAQEEGADSYSRPVTIREVAAAAGVSVTTVSHVLNGTVDKPVKDSTRLQVVAAAEQLRYEPNRLARGLRTRRSGLIGLLIENVGCSRYGGRLIEGAQRAAHDEGYTLMVASSPGGGLARDDAFRALRENHVEGIIFAPLMLAQGDPSSDWRRSPLVLIDQTDAAQVLTSISADEYLAMRRLTRLTIAKGHRRIAFLAAWGDTSAIYRRRAAVTDEIQLDTEVALHTEAAEPTADGGYRAAFRALRSPSRPTVLLCYNDLMAAGAYRAGAEMGLGIPQDVSVVGFGDEAALGESLQPPLTTVGLPHTEMGAAAVHAILAVIEDRATTTAAVECPIIVRDSLGPPCPA